MPGLCPGCFFSHFPQPNMKSCKLSRMKNRHPNRRRLRGGGGEKASGNSLLVDQAIESAKKHNINLVPGVMNAADGNCAFDAVINNINFRECYSEKLDLSSLTYRQIWITELEMEASKFPRLGAGYNKEEQREHVPA